MLILITLRRPGGRTFSPFTMDHMPQEERALVKGFAPSPLLQNVF
jgi:hypothetical protein